VVRVPLAGARGLLGGWLLAATVTSLTGPAALAAWSAAGIGGFGRLAIGFAEILGAALFAFESTVVAGFVLLLGTLLVAAFVHIRLGESPWHLGAYALAAAGLLYLTHRVGVGERAGVAAG
jgi:hypothetical protein